MTNRRTEMHRLQELVRLHRMGTGPREVARLLKMSPNTERVYRLALSAEGLLEGDATALPELAVLSAAVQRQRPTPVSREVESSVDPWLAHYSAEDRT